jgi:hypothetical protein
MIECTFAHVSDVYRKGELRLWRSGIISWESLIHQSKKHADFTKRMWKMLRESAQKNIKALEFGNFEYFLENFSQNLLWRFYPNLINEILYLDIEMTGLSLETDYITTIATFDGKNIQYFVKDRNLADFPKLLEKFPAICTFDGEKVDLPFIEKEFNISLCHINFDLFLMSRYLHLSGGLKQLEKRLDLNRETLDGMDGIGAIILWEKFLQTKNEDYLTTLISYNIEDIIHLPRMLFQFYELLRQQFQLPEKRLKKPDLLTNGSLVNPIQPISTILAEILEIIPTKDFNET